MNIRVAVLVGCSIGTVLVVAAGLETPQPVLPRPTAAQAAWHDLELGMFIHFAPQTWQDSEDDSLATPPAAMNPAALDTDQWVRVAESMGARYVVFVAKHQGGFCWWQTMTTEYGVRKTPWRNGQGDVLADLSASCRKRGLKLGVYLSPRDDTLGAGLGGRTREPARQAGYERIYREQLTEVLTRYGEMAEVWFDGNLLFDVGDLLATHAPDAVHFQGPQASIRWVGNEDGLAPYPAWNTVRYPWPGVRWGDYTAAQGDPSGNRWLPIECDARIRSRWFWRTDNAHTLKTVDALMDMYYRSVGHGAVLLLNQTPDRSGLIPEADAARAAEFGAEIARRVGRPVAETRGAGDTVTLTLDAPSPVEHIATMEDIREGERVRSYVIEGRQGDRWIVLASGTAIGHKKIDRVAGHVVSAVRLRVLDRAAPPLIRSFAVYRTTPR
jgi:alpha-L-fucosidase